MSFEVGAETVPVAGGLFNWNVVTINDALMIFGAVGATAFVMAALIGGIKSLTR